MEIDLAGFPIVIELPVVWGEMDAFGHVNQIVYLRHFETARMAYFEKIGYLALRQATGLGPILASLSCDFKKPLVYPDTVRVSARISELHQDRFLMEHRVVSQRLGALAAKGNSLVVSFNYREARKVPIPDLIRERIGRLQAQDSAAEMDRPR